MNTYADWRQMVHERLPFYGHRNWIVIADAAYPAQSNPGIETVVIAEELPVVLHEVLAAIAASGHVKPIVHTDKELSTVTVETAPRVDECRAQLDELTKGFERSEAPHEEIIARLDQAAASFRILLLKTTTRIPYTTVFLQLDCAY